jgi:hypothetical protein
MGKKSFAFPSLKIAVCGEKHSENYTPEREPIYEMIRLKMHRKQSSGLLADDMREVADKIGWLYNAEDGRLYKDQETLRRHNEYLKEHLATDNSLQQASTPVISKER